MDSGFKPDAARRRAEEAGSLAWKFLRPTDDEFFRVIVEVPFVERRRIHRIEKLLDSIDENYDSMKRSLARLQVEISVSPP